MYRKLFKNIMKKIAILIIVAFLVSSCVGIIRSESTTSIEVQVGNYELSFQKQGDIIVDSLIKNDTAYYCTYILVCDSDSICHFSYTALLSPNQRFKAAFTPTKAFELYKELIVSDFHIPQLMLSYYNPQDSLFVEENLDDKTNCSLAYFIDITSKTDKWRVLESNNIPNKIYYKYDWQSTVHYDYMRYNADSAILTFTIGNSIESSAISSIDSAYVKFYDSIYAKGYNQFPLQLTDTISILDDATFNYTIGALLRGQKCGESTHTIRIHKSEIISEQDETHRYQGEIYEYDER